MSLEKLIFCLNNKNRRAILQILANKPLRVPEIIKNLEKHKKFYRQSVYRLIKTLHESGLIEKIDDSSINSHVKYQLKFKKIIINLQNMTYSTH